MKVNLFFEYHNQYGAYNYNHKHKNGKEEIKCP
jgi:hypothetical protein